MSQSGLWFSSSGFEELQFNHKDSGRGEMHMTNVPDVWIFVPKNLWKIHHWKGDS